MIYVNWLRKFSVKSIIGDANNMTKKVTKMQIIILVEDSHC
jgi:hypothetical protein